MATDIEIAREAKMKPIGEIATRLGIPEEALEPYGRTKAKIAMDWINQQQGRPDGKLVLVTAINPTPAGEGKTTTSVGLTDGLNRIGKNAAVCLREPSLGPSFGMKGGAAGGGFIVAICGDIMTMPGLPKVPSAENIRLENGQIEGLF